VISPPTSSTDPHEEQPPVANTGRERRISNAICPPAQVLPMIIQAALDSSGVSGGHARVIWRRPVGAFINRKLVMPDYPAVTERLGSTMSLDINRHDVRGVRQGISSACPIRGDAQSAGSNCATHSTW
jgi:hypothetical protein